jgi:hypothetical protein
VLRWRRPYFDWRPFAIYPLLPAGAGLFVYDAFNSGPAIWRADALGACCLLFLWRFALIGVLLRGDRIKVRGWFRTRVLRWEDVAAVRDGRDISRLETTELAFVLKSGERVRTGVRVASSDGLKVSLGFGQFSRMMAALQERHAASA